MNAGGNAGHRGGAHDEENKDAEIIEGQPIENKNDDFDIVRR